METEEKKRRFYFLKSGALQLSTARSISLHASFIWAERAITANGLCNALSVFSKLFRALVTLNFSHTLIVYAQIFRFLKLLNGVLNVITHQGPRKFFSFFLERQ